MVEIYRTDQQVLNTLTDIQDGCWINMVDPTSKELEQIAERFEIEPEDISSALDEEESSRISLEDGYTVILVDIPTPEVRHEKKMYTTIPLGIILKSEAIITVCKVDTPIINYFVRNKVKEFSTKKKMRFIYQMLFRSAFVYQANLRLIDKKRIEIEERVDGDTSGVSFGIVRGRERASRVNCVYFLEQTVGKRWHLTRRGSRLWRLPRASLVPLRFSSSGSGSAEGNMPINPASVLPSPSHNHQN